MRHLTSSFFCFCIDFARVHYRKKLPIDHKGHVNVCTKLTLTLVYFDLALAPFLHYIEMAHLWSLTHAIYLRYNINLALAPADVNPMEQIMLLMMTNVLGSIVLLFSFINLIQLADEDSRNFDNHHSRHKNMCFKNNHGDPFKIYYKKCI